jgi:hypothetical protein
MDNAAGSPHTISVSGTGMPAPVAQLNISPSSLSFSSFGGDPSALQSITVANTGGLAVQIRAVTATAGFNVLNACGGIVAPGGSCTVGVSFTPSGTPSGTGVQAGTLTIQDDAPGSPQTVQLSGQETDVAFSVASGSATSATINVGQTATYNLAVTPADGFTGTLAVSCTGAPAGMQCTGNPASLTISGANPVSVTFTVGPMASAENTLPFKGSSAALALALFFGLISASFRRAGQRLRRFSVTIVACALLLAGLSCGGGSSNPAPTPVQSSTTYVLNAVLTTASGQQVNRSLVLIVLGPAK